MGQKIYLMVQFSFPKPFKPEYGAKAKGLHDALKDLEWIDETMTASGGVGAGPSSIWAFKLDGYASLDRLFKGDEPISKAYIDFFSDMDDVQDLVREEIAFS